MGVVISDRGDAVEMVVTGPWTQEAATAIRAGEVDRLVLNYALGFAEPSLDFLEGLPLRELVILSPQLSDLGPIYSLAPSLRTLRVTTNPALQLDLRRFPHLQELAAAWTQVAASIDAAAGVRTAALRGYQPADLTPLSALSGLVELVMKDRPKIKSLDGLSALPELRVLGIYLAKDLTDVEALRGRSGIEELALQSCRRITRLDPLSECTGLRRVDLSECGDLISLAPIGGLTNLTKVSLFGSTNITDNDLSPLLTLPQLRQLRMRSRRSYRPSVEEIQALLPRP